MFIGITVMIWFKNTYYLYKGIHIFEGTTRIYKGTTVIFDSAMR